MSNTEKFVLVTGASGMIGSAVSKKLIADGNKIIGVDICDSRIDCEGYVHCKVNLGDKGQLNEVFKNYNIDRVIHLAAIAHAFSNGKVTYEQYYCANVECAKNVFEVCEENDIPVLFISTADVYGFVKGIADASTVPNPISDYAKSKVMAEQVLEGIYGDSESKYDVFRLAPVYTDEIKRDIQKRYYLKYPNLAYIIGKGSEYEFLNINTLCERISKWIYDKPANKIFNVKDDVLVSTSKCIYDEKKCGRAKVVIKVPSWMVKLGFKVIFILTGKNKYTFLLNKAVNPLRTR